MIHVTMPVPTGSQWVSRCDLCGKRFLYDPNPSKMTVINVDDIGEQRGHVWGHTRCLNRVYGEKHE